MLTVVGVLVYVLYQQKKMADKIEQQTKNVSEAVASAIPMLLEQQVGSAVAASPSVSQEEMSFAASTSLAEAVGNDDFINALRFRIYEMEQADILQPHHERLFREEAGITSPNIVEIDDVKEVKEDNVHQSPLVQEGENEPEVTVEDLDLEQLSSLMESVTNDISSRSSYATPDSSSESLAAIDGDNLAVVE